jgi:hypothetical protein
VATSKEVAEEYTKKPDYLGGSNFATIDDDFLKPELSILFNMNQVKTLYGKAIEESARGFMEQAKQAAPQTPLTKPEDEKLMAESTAEAWQSMDFVCISFNLQPKQLGFNLSASFKDGSKLGGIFGNQPQQPLELLSKLPSGHEYYVVTNWGKTNLERFYLNAPEFVLNDRADDAEVAKYTKLLSECGERIRMGKLNEAKLTLAHHTKASELIQSKITIFKKLKAGDKIYSGRDLSASPVVSATPMEYQGYSFTVIHVAIDFQAAVGYQVDDSAREKAIAELKREWPEGSTIWLGAKNETFLEVTASCWDEAKEKIDAALETTSPFGANDNAKELLALLPKHAGTVLFFETTAVINTIVQNWRTSPVENNPFAKWEPIQSNTPAYEKSYQAAVVSASVNRIKAQYIIPFAALKPMAHYFSEAFGKLQEQNDQ